jgi:hypothetical protein
VAFPTVDLRDLLIPWEKSFSVKLGIVAPETILTMEANRYDFAPVFDGISPATLIGLISRARLSELNSQAQPLTSEDRGINRPEVNECIQLDALLELMKTTAATIVTNSQSDQKEALGLFTRADLNRHPFRAEIYFSLAHFVGELAKLIRRMFDNASEWLSLLSEDKRVRIVDYWELSKTRGVDDGPVSGAFLTELLQVSAKWPPIRELLGYNSRKSFDHVTSSIPDLRNQVMHPVRPLITDEDSISKLHEDLETVFDMLERLRKTNRGLRGIAFKRT